MQSPWFTYSSRFCCLDPDPYLPRELRRLQRRGARLPEVGGSDSTAASPITKDHQRAAPPAGGMRTERGSPVTGMDPRAPRTRHIRAAYRTACGKAASMRAPARRRSRCFKVRQASRACVLNGLSHRAYRSVLSARRTLPHAALDWPPRALALPQVAALANRLPASARSRIARSRSIRWRTRFFPRGLWLTPVRIGGSGWPFTASHAFKDRDGDPHSPHCSASGASSC